MTAHTPIIGPLWPACPGRSRRSRQGIVVGAPSSAAQAVPDVSGWVSAEDPYTALVMVMDDPTDWQVMVLDAEAFASMRTTQEFLRILEHEELTLPVIVVNAPEELALQRLGEDLPQPMNVRRSAVFATP